MDYKTVKDYIMTFNGVTTDNSYQDSLTGFKILNNDEDRLFALLKNSQPVQISLKCEAQLAQLLRSKYETVMPGKNLNQKYWNTILLTGQLSWEDIQGLIILSFNLVKDSDQ